jgi:hypothetical protein
MGVLDVADLKKIESIKNQIMRCKEILKRCRADEAKWEHELDDLVVELNVAMSGGKASKIYTCSCCYAAQAEYTDCLNCMADKSFLKRRD